VTVPVSPRANGWRSGWRLARYYPRRYLLGGTLWAFVQILPLFPGLLLKAAFDRIAPQGGTSGSALPLLAVLAAVEVTRAATLLAAIISWSQWWWSVSTWLRGNLLHGVLLGRVPPSARLPGSAGEAIGRFRDDVDDVIWLTDGWVDLAGAVVLAVVGVVVMVAVDPLLAAVVVVPSMLVVLVTRWLGNRIRRLHRGLRQSGAAVTSFVADVFSSVQALKTAGAEQRVLARFRKLNANRGDAAVRAEVASTLLQNVSAATADLSVGVVLLIVASAMRRGDFTVGDLALFTSYAATMTALPRRAGYTLSRARAAGIATERLAPLLPDTGADGLFAHSPVYLTAAPPRPAPVSRPAGDALVQLEARGLTASPVAGRRGIEDTDVTIRAGEFVVVTGAVGAGKSTLVRALLGLAPLEAGSITWNGHPVCDPGAELVPPRVAYVAQVPRLFSAALDENVMLGWPASRDDVDRALQIASISDDVAAMADGLATLVGPRGMRLSGGQAQRTAAARALIRQPDLLVVDDLASALDPQTESRLWSALAELPTACLAVSHRPAVLEAADRVIVLDRGRVVGEGTLPALRGECAELRRLWYDADVFR
jgi:ATP-binding cassette subfamily B protein